MIIILANPNLLARMFSSLKELHDLIGSDDFNYIDYLKSQLRSGQYANYNKSANPDPYSQEYPNGKYGDYISRYYYFATEDPNINISEKMTVNITDYEIYKRKKEAFESLQKALRVLYSPEPVKEDIQKPKLPETHSLYYGGNLVETYLNRSDGIDTMNYIKHMVSARIYVDDIFPQPMGLFGNKTLELLPGHLPPDNNKFADMVKDTYEATKKAESTKHLFAHQYPYPYFK